MRNSLIYALIACAMLAVAGCEKSRLRHYQYASVTPLRDYKFKDKRVVSYNIDVLEFIIPQRRDTSVLIVMQL